VKHSQRTLICLALASAFFGACSDEEPPPPPKPVQTAPPPKPPPAIDAEVKARLDADIVAANALVEQARAAKKAGRELNKTKGKGAGKEMFSNSASLYYRAEQKLAQWTETTAVGVNLTSEQREYYTDPLKKDRQLWIQEAAEISALMQF
jgi:hypothetical protein